MSIPRFQFTQQTFAYKSIKINKRKLRKLIVTITAGDQFFLFPGANFVYLVIVQNFFLGEWGCSFTDFEVKCCTNVKCNDFPGAKLTLMIVCSEFK